MQHNFKDSLARGQAGEEAFMKIYPGLTRTDGRKHDFLTADGLTLELKTDGYDMSTGNFFVERFSDKDKQTPGSFWQSKADIFVYYFPKNKTYFVFSPDAALLTTLDEIIKGLRPIQIYNRSWVTVGYKVPREMLKHYYQEFRHE